MRAFAHLSLNDIDEFLCSVEAYSAFYVVDRQFLSLMHFVCSFCKGHSFCIVCIFCAVIKVLLTAYRKGSCVVKQVFLFG